LDGLTATAEWVDWLKAGGSPESTWRSYSSSVSRFLIHYVRGHPAEATSGDVVRFLAEVGKNGPHGRRQALKGLRSAYSYWVPAGICPTDPTGLVKKERKPKKRRQVALTAEELRRYLNAARARHPRRAAALMLAFGLGARRCEIAGLRPEDDHGSTVQVTGKYGKVRDISVKANARRALELLRPWYNGTVLGGIKPATITSWAHQAAVDSGLYPKVRGRVAHVLRASFISHALRNGASPVAVRDIAGHESLSTTDSYAMAFEEDYADAASRADLDLEDDDG
jgi:integrase/recombinase XerC